VIRYQKGKANVDFTEARDSEWQWHQLGHMQSLHLAADRLPCQHPTTQFLQAGCPSCRPTNSVKALKPILPAHSVNTYKVNDALTCASMKIVNWTENTHTETVDAQ